MPPLGYETMQMETEALKIHDVFDFGCAMIEYMHKQGIELTDVNRSRVLKGIIEGEIVVDACTQVGDTKSIAKMVAMACSMAIKWNREIRERSQNAQ